MARHTLTALSTTLGLACGLALVGCGKSDAPPPRAAAKPSAMAAANQGASAEEVAREARGRVACPAKIASPPRAANAPVDDVQGVRPGLAFDEAMNAVLCTHELLVAGVERGRGFKLKAVGAQEIRQGFSARFAEPRVVKTGKQIMQEMQLDAMARSGNAVREDLQPGQARWFVGTMGLPGQERVLSVARAERFAADQRPTLDAVTEALLKKYGAPSQHQRLSAQRTPLLRWAYDPLGRPVSETSPLYHRCGGASSPNGGVNLSPDCGVVVQAMLYPHRDNPALLDRMEIGVVDQAGGWRLLSATEQGLGQADQQRRAQEVENAAKSTKVPTL